MAAITRSTPTDWRSAIWGELLAEPIGTATLIAFGDGVVAMAVAARRESSGTQPAAAMEPGQYKAERRSSHDAAAGI